RNQYLSAEERHAAPVLFRALTQAQQLYADGERDAERIKTVMQHVIAAEPLSKLEYIAINDAHTLAPLIDLQDQAAVISLAVRFGNTRLIDNLLLP
ncbi:MAG: pantoate--beta-alanine ligase, partial [Blastocatellia bacterium]|nr:pantoate--beta-alanine ligase [Blastocatellia bacterium]